MSRNNKSLDHRVKDRASHKLAAMQATNPAQRSQSLLYSRNVAQSDVAIFGVIGWLVRK